MGTRRRGTAAACLAAIVLAGCGTNPTASEEYRDLVEEADQLRSDLTIAQEDAAEMASDLDEVEAERADLQDELDETTDQLAVSQEEVEQLRLRYDDQIRADLQSAYDAEVARVCDVAAENPESAVSTLTRWDADWELLDATPKDLDDEVAACAGPRRAEAQLTRDEAAEAMGPVVDLVLGAIRSTDPDHEAIRDEITGIVSDLTDGAIYEDSGTDWVQALTRIGDERQYCSNFGCTWVSYLEDLMLLEARGAPRYMMVGGDRTVGEGEDEARPGTWIAYDVDDCYWERLDDRGEIIDNNFVSAAPQVQVTIRASDHAFNSSGCARWLMFP